MTGVPPGERPRFRSLRDRLAHDLATAEAYQATYANQVPAADPYVAAMRANNDDEIRRLRDRIAAPDSGASP